jgi:hypothetical protein
VALITKNRIGKTIKLDTELTNKLINGIKFTPKIGIDENITGTAISE